jgi:hypothetical protein
MADDFGPACNECGHPAKFHNRRACYLVPEGRTLLTCDCRGYKPGEVVASIQEVPQDVTEALLEINRHTLRSIRHVVRNLQRCTPGLVDMYVAQLDAILKEIGV